MVNAISIGIIVLLCLPGIEAMSRASAQLLAAKPDNRLSARSLYLLTFGQTLAIAAVCAAAGVYWGPRIGIRDSVIEGAARSTWQGEELLVQLGAGALAGVICAIGWMVVYYGFVRKKLDEETVWISEGLRARLGLWTRVTSGGIVEEVIFRWGLLTALAWGLSWLSLSDEASIRIALLVSGLLFGLAHLPGNLEEGCKPTPLFVWTAILGNFWVTLFCGYALLEYGLIAAMVVHILFHILWYPWDRRSYRTMSATRGGN
ncbi:CPBP family intramembrane glutamic endopeptidase [Cohnella boryungensis]|uniref:CPBP family intramembrane glutamic endopeptidase n=1 Tax=Cohnella boryungensis TaxID=768479 RepID=A0ABV8S6G4_9BACL